MVVGLLERFIDFVVPRTCPGCDQPITGKCAWCRDCAAELIRLAEPALHRDHGCPIICPYSYAGPVTRAIHRFKFDSRPELGAPLGSVIADVWPATLNPQDAILVPVPLDAHRLVERGYNQSALLAAALGKRLRLARFCAALTRLPALAHQVGANKQQRAQQVARAFIARSPKLRGRQVVLIDDVVTTGATSQACAKALEAAGAQVIAVAAVARVL